MLARSSTLRHPSRVTLETPLLVPSFSSKGFSFKKELSEVRDALRTNEEDTCLQIGREKGLSEVTDALRTTTEVLTECMLVSAYDIFHEHIPPPDKFPRITEITFVDSGGYETADGYDFSAVFRHPYPIENWDEASLRSVLDSWPDHIPAVFVNFDCGSLRRPLKDQIAAAREFFAHYPGHLHDIILKPETHEQRYLEVSSILSHIEELGQFDIVGVTEKELGKSLLSRMRNIARIRRALDEAKIDAPLQIFGSLDPLTSPLYFLAGAEIFDGLTWLRYSYLGGTAIYQHNYGALCVGVHASDDLVKAKALFDNIYYLQELKYQMRDFLLEQDFHKFKHHSEFLSDSYDTLCTELGGRI